MRIGSFFLATILATFLTFAADTPVKKSPPAKRTAAKSSKRKAKSSALKGVTGARNHQANPSPERYKEIQQALASKGYLKSEPNGVWDSQSTDALRQFQADKKLDPSGKINAPSLIGLGLGPQPPASAPQIPAPVSPAPAPQ
jgi:hypothetical protein